MRGLGCARYSSLGIIFFTVTSPFQLGVENLTDSFLKSLGHGALSYRVALITNQTGVTQAGARTVDVLLQHNLKVKYILAPEHGFDGQVQAGVKVHHGTDAKTGIPIVSMYETTDIHKGKRIRESVLADIDVLFFDIQDSGMRHYTYISSLFYALDSAARAHKKIVVLDRPNPLGDRMEGPLVDENMRSFISIAPIPLRHGMTVGELACFFNTHVLGKKAHLQVVPMRDYVRTMHVMLRAPLSPNLKTIASCYGYSFLGLCGEIEPFDVGVGTPLAFQVLSVADAHHIKPYEWHKIGAIFAQHGIHATPYSYHHSLKKKPYTGLRFHLTDPNTMHSFDALIEVLLYFKKIGLALHIKPVFDKAVGTPMVRDVIEGKKTETHLMKTISHDLAQFLERAKGCFLYFPIPRTMGAAISHI